MPKFSDILDSRLYEIKKFGSSSSSACNDNHHISSHGHSDEQLPTINSNNKRSGNFYRKLIIDKITGEINEVIISKKMK